MKISIIVPVYKVEKYLSACIESVLAQTYPDWELLLVDDGSPDSCPAICDEYAQKDSRIRAIHKENGGVSSARNRGLDEAKGGWIMFLDSDDMLVSCALTILYERINQTLADVVCCQIQMVSETGNTIGKSIVFPCERLSNIEYIERLSAGKGILGVPAKLYRKELIENVRFKEGLKIGEDYLFQLMVFYNTTSQIEIVSDCLYLYRIISSSVTRSKSDALLEMRNQLINALIEFYENADFDKKSIRRGLLYTQIVVMTIGSIMRQGVCKNVLPFQIDVIKRYNDIELIENPRMKKIIAQVANFSSKKEYDRYFTLRFFLVSVRTLCKNFIYRIFTIKKI